MSNRAILNLTLMFAACCVISSLFVAAARQRAVDDEPKLEQGHPIPPLPAELVGLVRFDGRAEGHWTHPGLDPFKGDASSALAAMGIPEPHRSQMVEKIKAGHNDDIVCASKNNVVSQREHQPFFPGMAMTFGEKTIVYNQQAAFNGQQCGRLFILSGFFVWVPYVCGNFTRLMPWLESNDYAQSDRPNVLPGYGPETGGMPGAVARRARDFARPFFPGALGGPGGGGIGDRRGQPYVPGPAPRVTNVVPEPDALALVFLGAFLMLVAKRSTNRRGTA